MPTTTTPADEAKQLHDLIDGLTNHPPPGVTSMTVEGDTYTLPELLTALGDAAKKYDDAEAADTAHTLAVQVRNDAAPAAQKLVRGVRRNLKGMLGSRNPLLAEFGVTPDKVPTPLTADQKVEKVAKTKATRSARHTLGPKQKSKIKGVVPPKP